LEINLAGKSALVTGGNVGIGCATARMLADCGADVVTTYRNPDLRNDCDLAGTGHFKGTFQVDVTDSAQVDEVVAKAAAALGGHIDILINNAGAMVRRQLMAEMDDAFWHLVIDTNLSGTFYCTRAVLPFMNRGWGRIVNAASLAGRDGGGSGAGPYATAKSGIIGLTRAWAKELAPRGITVNALAAGLILETPFQDSVTPKDVQQQIASRLPVGRPGKPVDVAWATVYFCSELAGFVTGEVAEINGGIYFS
jgi:3-oxoacyl-[acyl-carrier protein] reductase